MRIYKAKTVDGYISAAPEGARAISKELREIMLDAAPEVEEKISWGIPFYRYKGVLGGFAAMRGYVDFGFCDYLTDEVKKEFEAAGYATKKKIIQIRFDQKVPTSLIAKLVKARVKANEVGKG
ncbi:DUF1801 domain-containing protein [Candidatus Saccharibacteria bacterium]|nr:DUF1801 domain-containing protein [Candidatus Saccharibacteria bacterium]